MQKKCLCGMCQGACHVVVEIEDDRIVKVMPDRESDRSRLCPRAAHTADALYGQTRIMHPLVREGERGEGKLRRATWDEALDRAAELVRGVVERHGARAMVSYFGRGVLGTPVARLAKGSEAFVRRLGSPNDTSCSSICNLSANTIVPAVTLGMVTRQMLYDIEHADYIFAWGKNAASDEGPRMLLKRIKAAQERGAKLIVVDPRQSGLGEIADWWVPVRPGSDGALALALLKIIVGRGAYDAAFVRDFTRGFDELGAYLDTLSLDVLAFQCGIDRTDIEKLADIIASTIRATLVSYTGLEYQPSALQNNRAIYVLWAITGKIDAEGGIYLNARGAKEPVRRKLPEGAEEPIGYREFPLFYQYIGQGEFVRFPKAVLEDDPYPVRGAIVIGGSPACSFPEGDTWRAAYRKLDCLIAIDRFLTEEARFADVVLPACSLFETVRLGFDGGTACVFDAVVPPAGEARNDVLILSDLARRLGIDEGYPHTDEELRAWMLAGAGTPYTGVWETLVPENATFRKYATGELRADGEPGFPTPTGKFEIVSTILAEAGIDPLPKYDDIRAFADASEEEYPFILMGGSREDARMGVFGANVPKIAAVDPFPQAEICREDADALGVSEGDLVRVSTAYGSLVLPVHVCGMARGAVHVPHGGGSAYMVDAWRVGNVNDLASLDLVDPATGFALLKTLPCKIERAAV